MIKNTQNLETVEELEQHIIDSIWNGLSLAETLKPILTDLVELRKLKNNNFKLTLAKKTTDNEGFAVYVNDTLTAYLSSSLESDVKIYIFLLKYIKHVTVFYVGNTEKYLKDLNIEATVYPIE